MMAPIFTILSLAILCVFYKVSTYSYYSSSFWPKDFLQNWEVLGK